MKSQIRTKIEPNESNRNECLEIRLCLAIEKSQSSQNSQDSPLDLRVIVHNNCHHSHVGRHASSSTNDFLRRNPVLATVVQGSIINLVIIALKVKISNLKRPKTLPWSKFSLLQFQYSHVAWSLDAQLGCLCLLFWTRQFHQRQSAPWVIEISNLILRVRNWPHDRGRGTANRRDKMQVP